MFDENLYLKFVCTNYAGDLLDGSIVFELCVHNLTSPANEFRL